MAWNVLCSNVLLQQLPSDSGPLINYACCYAVPFDENGDPILDGSGNPFTLTGKTPLLASYRQPADFWSLLTGDLDTQLTQYDGYTSATFYRVDLPAA